MIRIRHMQIVLKTCCVLFLIHSQTITAKTTKQRGINHRLEEDAVNESSSGCQGCQDYAKVKEERSSHTSVPKTLLNTHLEELVGKGKHKIMGKDSKRKKGLPHTESDMGIRDKNAKQINTRKLKPSKVSTHNHFLKEPPTHPKKQVKKVFKGYLLKHIFSSGFEDAQKEDFINDMAMQGTHEDDGWIWDMLDRDLKVKSPNLSRNYEDLMLHLHGIFQNFGYSIQKLESKCKHIFKGIRNDIMLGAIHVVENLNKISDVIYGSVLGLTNFTRNLIIKVHNKKHENKDQLLATLTEPVIGNKDFILQLAKTYESQRKMELTLRVVQNFKMKSMQGQARLKQVRQHFSENYDRVTIRDLFSYLNVTILSINRSLRKSPPLREIQRKMEISGILNEEFSVVRRHLSNSSDILNKSFMLFKEMQSVFTALKLKIINSYDVSKSKPSTFQGYSGQKLVWKAKMYAKKLENTSSSLQRHLFGQKAAAVLLLSRNYNGYDITSVRHVAFDLQRVMKEMYSSLDLIRKYIGGKSLNTLPKTCTMELEGSGADDSLKSSSDCTSEGSGISEFADTLKAITDDEDFSFIDESQQKMIQEPPPLRQLTLDVTEYTSRLLKQSHNMYWNAQNLHNKFNSIKSRTLMLQRKEFKPKIFIADVAEKSLLFQEVKTKIHQVFRKVEFMKTYKWDDSVKKVNDILKKVKKNQLSQEIKPPEGANKTDLQDTESKLVSSQNSMRLLRSMTIKGCEKIRTQLINVKLNISSLQKKVERAREMLTSLQIAISKEGQGHIPIPIMQDTTSSLTLTTSIQISIKPSSLDGMVLMLAGNKSTIVGIFLDKGVVKITLNAIVVDFGFTPLTVTQWYTLDML